MTTLIDLSEDAVAQHLDLLLKDKTTGQNIIWATDTYAQLGCEFMSAAPIDRTVLLQHPNVIRPRIQKSLEIQTDRTRKKAEVFTPAWLCNLMNNYCDEDWFGRKDVFNTVNEDHSWKTVKKPIVFPERNTWQQYVDSKRLEITCGEAPYLVSRYDVATGKIIAAPKHRIGQLDRKLRIVNENTANYDDWIRWTVRSFESCYGYEYQGDNLLIARINLLLTFLDYYRDRWNREPEDALICKVVDKIVWNVWQMDGLTNAIPSRKSFVELRQMPAFGMSSKKQKPKEGSETVYCKICDWRKNKFALFDRTNLVETKEKEKIFSYVIGNPPYQSEFSDDGNKTYAAPVYNLFMDAAEDVGKKVELIHPARFLFNAGSTPKAWNKKKLADPHFKVLQYEENAAKVFPNTDIKGGIAITYRDAQQDFGAIKVFTKYDILNSILQKILHSSDFIGMNTIVITRAAYKLTDSMHRDHPEARYKEDKDGKNIGCLNKGHDYDFATNIFDRIPQIFFDVKPDDGNTYICILGRENHQRVYKYVRKEYINDPPQLFRYSIALPKANNKGEFGEVLSQPIMTEPGVGSTETFLSVGAFDTKEENENCLKYISTKFARALLGILKTTQDLTPAKWSYVPLQNFELDSDIDWAKTVHDIDLQLYKKYGLNEEEIDFIETHVQKMK